MRPPTSANWFGVWSRFDARRAWTVAVTSRSPVTTAYKHALARLYHSAPPCGVGERAAADHHVREVGPQHGPVRRERAAFELVAGRDPSPVKAGVGAPPAVPAPPGPAAPPAPPFPAPSPPAVLARAPIAAVAAPRFQIRSTSPRRLRRARRPSPARLRSRNRRRWRTRLPSRPDPAAPPVLEASLACAATSGGNRAATSGRGPPASRRPIAFMGPSSPTSEKDNGAAPACPQRGQQEPGGDFLELRAHAPGGLEAWGGAHARMLAQWQRAV